MDNEPLVSIVVPVYNHEKYVAATVRSLIAQTYSNLELIVINDGSQDSSLDVVHQLATDCQYRFKRYLELDQLNEGGAAALNRGIEASQGELLFFIASDDLVEPGAIKVLVPEMLQDPELGLVCGDADFIDGNGASIEREAYNGKRFSSFVRFHIESKSGFDLAADFGTYGSFIDHNYIPIGLLIRKCYFLRSGCYDPTFVLEDWGAWLSLSKICRFKFVDQILCHYRLHGENTFMRAGGRLKSDLVRLMLREAQYCITHGLAVRWRRFTEEGFDAYRINCESEIGRLKKMVEEMEQDAGAQLSAYERMASAVAERDKQLVNADEGLRRLTREVKDADNNLRQLLAEVRDRDERLAAADAELRRLLMR
jgi:alpha-1,3-rhamnosyltransferase